MDYELINFETNCMRYGSYYYKENESEIIDCVIKDDIDKFVGFSIVNPIDLTQNDYSILKISTVNRAYRIIKYLLESGMSINVADNFLIKYTSGYSNEFLEYLIDNGADISVNDNFPLRFAVYCGNLPSVKLLIDHGADIHCKNGTPICLAYYYKHYDTFVYLLNCGVDISVRNNFLLRDSVKNNNILYAGVLLDIGVSLTCLDRQLLLNVISNRNVLILKLLLDYGLDLTIFRNYEPSDGNGLIDLLEDSGLDLKTVAKLLY